VYLDLIVAPLAQHNGAIVVLQDKTSEFKLLEMGKDFIANASHELKTPITIIRGFAETLQDLPDISKEMLRDITAKIVKTCGRLDKLVKSLLTLSDIENLPLERFHLVDLVAIAENCKHLVAAAHRDARLTLHSALNRAPLLADSDLLELALMNLLDNAVKYSPSPAQIEIQIAQADSQVCVKIRDQGIGIPEADIPHIFERFYTVDKARSRKSGGAGLGLSIVKTIIEKHGGWVSVESQPGKGSTFTITLPLNAV
jgi:signal transduction histidine kinase